MNPTFIPLPRTKQHTSGTYFLFQTIIPNNPFKYNEYVHSYVIYQDDYKISYFVKFHRTIDYTTVVNRYGATHEITAIPRGTREFKRYVDVYGIQYPENISLENEENPTSMKSILDQQILANEKKRKEREQSYQFYLDNPFHDSQYP